MPVDILVGGQYGSEGKGKIARYLADEYDVAFRGGSENAGHSFFFGEKKLVNQVVPVAWVNPRCFLVIANGAAFSIAQLKRELAMIKEFDPQVEDRLVIEPNAMVITDDDVKEEQDGALFEHIGSTQHGCGAAQARKVRRRPNTLVAGDYPELEAFTKANYDEAEWRSHRRRIMLEGTQGTFLSLNHTPRYPKATGRDAIASAIAAECGFGPKEVRDIIMVVRTYPIRVAGNSGPAMGAEISWRDVSWAAGRLVEESTTVTKRVRRVFEFSMAEVAKAVALNTPTQIALTFADYLGKSAYEATRWEDLPPVAQRFVQRIEREVNVPVTLISTSPKNEHTIDLRDETPTEEWTYPWS